jgi:hypothetical protein
LLLTSLKANKKRIAFIYSLRCGSPPGHIECMFKNLKCNCFSLEDLSTGFAFVAAVNFLNPNLAHDSQSVFKNLVLFRQPL